MSNRLAYRSGVTVAIAAPVHAGFLGGLSAAFALGAPHKLARGAVVQEVAAVHVSMAHGARTGVSTEVATLRQYLLSPPGGEAGKWFAEVVDVRMLLFVFAH